MSGVDVLAVMADALGDVMAAQVAGLEVETKAPELSAAIAAVAKLIEAARVIEERIAYYANLGENAEQNIEDWAYTDNSGDIARYRAALARVTGGAP